MEFAIGNEAAVRFEHKAGDKIRFTSDAPLPQEEQLLEMLQTSKGRDKGSLYGIPSSALDSNTELAAEFYAKLQAISQEASAKYPHIDCTEELSETEMNWHVLTTEEHDEYVKSQAVPLAKSLGLI